MTEKGYKGDHEVKRLSPRIHQARTSVITHIYEEATYHVADAES